MRKIQLLLPILILFSNISCDSDYVPKPRGYFRISLPEKEYTTYNSSCPFVFEYPTYSKITYNTANNSEPCWINIEYPSLNGKVNFTYKKLNNNLNECIEDSRSFVNKHIPKANAIDNRIFVNYKDNVFGLVYDIKGTGTASPYQFYLTDSLNHFLRGALYFNHVPNNDSLSPVIQFIKKDLEHLISTLKWKE